MVVVVRYFGGTKLGVSGLISAYKKAAQLALENAEIINKELEDAISITCDYTEVNDLMNYLKRIDIDKWEEKYDEVCHLSVKIAKSKSKTLTSWLENGNFTYKVSK
jgi:putative IMPACT (imprinted ancient) family translation regulator